MQYLVHIPEYFYLGIGVVWHYIHLLPWPTWAELFKSLVVFVFLWRPRKWLERYWLGKTKRRGTFPSTTDHQAASSSLGDLFSH